MFENWVFNLFLTTLLWLTHTSSCETVNLPDSKQDLCPCLPKTICPRIYGASPDDERYLGNYLKCPDTNFVRCCGVSLRIAPKGQRFTSTESTKTTATTSESPSLQLIEFPKETTITSNFPEVTTITSPPDTTIVDDLNGIDPLTTLSSEKNSVTVDVPTETIKINRPKMVDNIMVVYPNEMSGEPKTKPKTMSIGDTEMKMFDEEMGTELHVIFPMIETTVLPETTVKFVETTEQLVETKKPIKKFNRKRRRKFGLNSIKTTTSSTTQTIESTEKPTTTTTTSIPKFIKISRSRLFNSHYRKSSTPTNTTERININVHPTEQSVDNMEKPKEARHRLFDRVNSLRRRGSTTTTTTTPIPIIDEPISENEENMTIITLPLPITIERDPNIELMSEIDRDHKLMIEQVREALSNLKPETVIPITDVENNMIDVTTSKPIRGRIRYRIPEQPLLDLTIRVRQMTRERMNRRKIGGTTTTTTVKPTQIDVTTNPYRKNFRTTTKRSVIPTTERSGLTSNELLRKRLAVRRRFPLIGLTSTTTAPLVEVTTESIDDPSTESEMIDDVQTNIYDNEMMIHGNDMDPSPSNRQYRFAMPPNLWLRPWNISRSLVLPTNQLPQPFHINPDISTITKRSSVNIRWLHPWNIPRMQQLPIERSPTIFINGLDPASITKASADDVQIIGPIPKRIPDLSVSLDLPEPIQRTMYQLKGPIRVV